MNSEILPSMTPVAYPRTARIPQIVRPKGVDELGAFGAYDLRDTGDVLGYASGVMEGRISLFTNWRP